MYNFYSYQWHCVEEDDITLIKIFGIDENNNSVYVCVNDFTPYIYLELPDDKVWNKINTQRL